MIINHNLQAMNANRMMNINSTNASKSMQKLSSGMRINSAADDAAGLAISEKMRGQIRGLDQASSNAQDATSLIQTAEGGLNETTSILQRMRELAVQSATDTNTADDRTKIQSEVDQLAKEITRISNTTEFNTQNLLAGGLNDTFQIGANQGQNINLTVNAMDSKSLGVAGDVVTTSFTGTNTSVNGVSNVAAGLNGYKVATLAESAASTGTVIASGVGTGTVSGTYSGSTDASYVVKVTGVTSGNVTAAQYSKDGGTTWTNATVDGSFNVTLDDGLILGTSGTNAANDTFSFAANAEYKNVELQTSTGTAVGSAVKVYNNMSGATIGNSTTGQTATITFSFATLATTAQADALTQVTTISKAAVLGPNGAVTTDAVTQKGIDVSTQPAANLAIKTIDNAINTVSQERAKLGAYQNRLEHTIANLGTSSENLSSAESRIRDVDMAKEMSEYSKNNILSQAAQAMLAQANQQPQSVLQLLK